MDEDFVEYHIYPTEPMSESQLGDLRDTALKHLAVYIVDYLWHIDPFHLKIIPGKVGEAGHLSGKLHFGDNIEDEWFAIAIVLRLTSVLPVVATVRDGDGEVLLIEAADKIPKWAQEPELSDGRVFVFNGEIHLIPIARTPAELTPIPSSVRPTIDEAVATVIQYPDITRASQAVQSAIRQRLKDYPDSWSDQQHHFRVRVPPAVRNIVRKSPQLLSAAVRTFYARDVSDLRACRVMAHFPPQSLVETRIRLTKCLYAMLAKPRFLPDKKSGWDLPPESDSSYKSSMLGMKLTCGFEMLAAQAAKRDRNDPSGIDSASSSQKFNMFVMKLKDSGYFQGEMEGSKKYNEILERARQFYVSSTEDEEDEENGSDKRFSFDILDLATKFKSNNLPDSETDPDDLQPSDDESWLDVGPESFDDLLKQHFKLDSDRREDLAEASAGPDITELPQEIKRFLQSLSEFDGIQIHHNKDLQSDDMLNLDPDLFEAALQKALNPTMTNEQAGEDIDTDDSDDDDDDDNDEMIDLDRDQVSEEMAYYFKDMRNELEGTSVPAEAEEWSKPLNVDSQVLKNLLQSYKSQEGMGGPTSTLLEPLGIVLDKE